MSLPKTSQLTSQLFACLLLIVLATATPWHHEEPIPQTSGPQASDYAPIYGGTCPTTLVRPASDGVGPDEKGYVTGRKREADTELKKWLQAINTRYALTNDGLNTMAEILPTLALASSGGGWRALTLGAGVISGLDNRENNGNSSGVSGLYQALTYQTGLSGGSWLLSSIMGNGWPTISWLKANVWHAGFDHDLLIPSGHSHLGTSLTDLTQIKDAVEARKTAKEENDQNGTTLTDWWGRLLSYELFPRGTMGGISLTLSAVANTTAGSLWNDFQVPFPIITSIDVDSSTSCDPNEPRVQYEFSPYWFGSWSLSFFPTKYLGTSMKNGVPLLGCTTKYDNLGFMLGTSSTLFNEICVEQERIDNNVFLKGLLDLWKLVGTLTTRDNFATYPNPFYGMQPSTVVTSQRELYMVDGGESSENDPIWPLLYRPDVNVIIVDDNTANVNEWPSGMAIYQTYQRAQQLGLSRMPWVPKVDHASETARVSPQFYGCSDSSHILIIYVPNRQFDPNNIQANQTTLKQSYLPEETDGMILNGKLTVTQNDDRDWPLCVACAMMKNFQTFTGTLSESCKACFTKYCSNPL